MNEPIHIISLGAGVQSSTMALMAAAGEITPMPKCAIFADTQDEPKSVYVWLDWLEKQLPFPVHKVTAGRLSERSLKMKTTADGRRYSSTDIPFFTLSSKNQIGRIVQRSCTADFKLKPLFNEAKKIANIKRGQKTVGVIQWIGISLDEIYRVKPSREKWCESRWPLVDARMSRSDCLRWMSKRGFPTPPRSACVFCPFHNNAEWRRLKIEEPSEFEKAVQFEKAVGKAKRESSNFDCVPYLHRSCKPLDTIDFSTEEEKGQGNLFNNECEGMCGV
jgi:hypothetical protein